MRIASLNSAIASLRWPRSSCTKPDVVERVEDSVRRQAGPDVVAAAQVGERQIELAEGEVGLAAVVVGERGERVRAGQLGGRDRLVELGDRLGVLALLGEPAAPVGADAHDLRDVAGALGVVEGDLVEAGVGGQVAAQGGEHRPRRVTPRRGRRRRRCAGPARAPARRTAAHPSASPRAQLITERHDEQARLLGEVAAVECGGGAQRRRPRRGGRADTAVRPACGRSAVAGRPCWLAASPYSGEGVVPVAALVGEVAAQFGELPVRCRRARRRRALRRALPSSAEPVGVLDRPAAPRRARSGSPTRALSTSASSRSPAATKACTASCERLGGRRRQRPPQERTADHRRCARGRGGRAPARGRSAAPSAGRGGRRGRRSRSRRAAASTARGRRRPARAAGVLVR